MAGGVLPASLPAGSGGPTSSTSIFDRMSEGDSTVSATMSTLPETLLTGSATNTGSTSNTDSGAAVDGAASSFVATGGWAASSGATVRMSEGASTTSATS